MRNIILFIAMSLDGYVADCSGGVDWLQGQIPGKDDMVSYNDFIKDVDVVLMGWNTYHQIATELSPTEWMYTDLTSYVITHKEVPSTKNIIFTHENPCTLVEKLKQEKGKNIWICGGAHVVQQLMREDFIDIYHISVIPTVLGDGIRLFDRIEKEMKLQLVNTQTYNGITDLVYKHRCI